MSADVLVRLIEHLEGECDVVDGSGRHRPRAAIAKARGAS